MKYVEKAGLVKFDFLGLKTLTVLAKAENLIKQKVQNFNLSQISLEDKKTYEMLSTGSTTGVFQLESSGMKDVLIGLKPDRFEDIIAVVSLYRPGPMDNIPSYIKRKHGKENIGYMHPSLEPILAETYGIFIYQEQVLRAAQILADFSLARADILRRAMGKKDKDEMSEQKRSFILGSKKRKISEEKAIEIFDQIAAFAGYGFNKSHAAAYALIAYQTAWIKTNYPHEFFVSMMTVENNNTEKLSYFVDDCKNLGIKILNPCINRSTNKFIIEELTTREFCIRYSLSSLKNVGNDAIEKIVQIRKIHGDFNNIDDFLNKIPYGLLTKKSFESLIKSGAFDTIENNRNKLFNSIDLMLNYSHSIEKEIKSFQSNLFKNDNKNQLQINLPNIVEWSFQESVNNEFLSLGLYLSHHPLDSYSKILYEMNIKKSIEILKDPENYFHKNVKLCGLVFKIQKRQSPRGRWASIQLNDLGGIIEVNVFSDILKKYENYLMERNLILIDAEIKNENNQAIRIVAKRIALLNDYISKNKYNMTLSVMNNKYIEELVPLMELLEFGHSDIFIKTSNELQQVKFKIKENIKLSSKLIDNLSKIRGVDNISFS